jgi:anti-anti-sigma factor
MAATRLRVRARRRNGVQVVKFQGEMDGSSACHALDFLARTPSETRELVLDLSGLTAVEPFGLAVLSRGLREVARARRVRILTTSARFLPILGFLADSLLDEPATRAVAT